MQVKEKSEEPASFLGLKVPKEFGGFKMADITWINKGIPMEIVLEQIRAFLKHQEEDFYNQWKNNLPDTDGEKSD